MKSKQLIYLRTTHPTSIQTTMTTEQKLPAGSFDPKSIELYNAIPLTEVFYLLRVTKPDKCCTHDLEPQAEHEWWLEVVGLKEIVNIQLSLANNRLMNRVCSQCTQREVSIVCDNCQLTFWCPRECREAHRVVHSTWCKKPYGPRDMGPMRTVVMRLPDGLRPSSHIDPHAEANRSIPPRSPRVAVNVDGPNGLPASVGSPRHVTSPPSGLRHTTMATDDSAESLDSTK